MVIVMKQEWKIMMEKKIFLERIVGKDERHESAFLHSLDVSSARQEAADDGKPSTFSSRGGAKHGTSA